MSARDQCSIFSAGGKFCPDYGLLLELHVLTLVTRSYICTLVPNLRGDFRPTDLSFIASIVQILGDLVTGGNVMSQSGQVDIG